MRYQYGGEFIDRDRYLERLIEEEDTAEKVQEYEQYCIEQKAMGMTQSELPDYYEWLDEECKGQLEAEESDAISIVGW